MSRLKLLFFASLAERLGCREMLYSPGDDIDTVSKLLDRLCEEDAKWVALKKKNIKVAVNQAIANKSHPVKEGDEVAFFPPVTGG